VYYTHNSALSQSQNPRYQRPRRFTPPLLGRAAPPRQVSILLDAKWLPDEERRGSLGSTLDKARQTDTIPLATGTCPTAGAAAARFERRSHSQPDSDSTARVKSARRPAGDPDLMHIYVDSIGCRLNHSEMESLARQLASHGHSIAGSAAEAELCVLNTCAVTGEAERKSRQAARRLRRANPDAHLILTGCYATLCPAPAAALPGAPRIVSNSEKGQLPAVLDLERQETVSPVWQLPAGRTRAFVKAQDGCDNRCTYCVTTIARGPSRSRPLPEIIAEIQALETAGYHEVVLTGVHVASYGRDSAVISDGASLTTLVKAILSETGICRLRLSSLEPWDLEPGFFSLWQNSRLCRQLHLPLQSGSAGVLRRMGRPITPQVYRALARSALALIPGLALTTDIIVGFPGETRDEFQESVDLAQALDFARLHVFSYSPRPGTAAAQMPKQVPGPIMRERGRQMRELGHQKQEAFQRRFLGQEMAVLWEARTEDGCYQGHTGNYIRVRAASSRPLRNTITRTLLTELRSGIVWGVVCGPEQRNGYDGP
jgi:threonylcarbamoyladenosine tRNA methylthiotransferase MtaB